MKRPLRLLLFALLAIAAARASAAVSLNIEIEGLTGRPLENARALLSIEQHKDSPLLSTSWIRRLHARAPNEIKQALAAFGYYRPLIHGELEEGPAGWVARYRVDPGPPLPVAKLDLHLTGVGSEDAEFQRLLAEFPLREGDVLDHERYEQGKRLLQKLATERGYFEADFTLHEVHVDLEAYTATIALHFATGPRYRFGQVSFDVAPVRPALLARFVPFKAGDPYDAAALLDLQNALSDSDYFEQVEVQPQRERVVDLQVPIHVALTPRKRTKYNLGIGYGTDTGVRGSVGMERRYVNVRGHRFTADLQASQIRTSVGARYFIPVRDPRTDRLVLRAERIDDNPKTSRSQTSLLGVALEQSLGLWRRTVSLSYQLGKYRVGEESGSSTLLMPGIAWTRIKGASPLYVSHGSRVGLELRGASESVVSDTSFMQARLHAKLIRQLGAKGRVIVRGELGTSWIPEIRELPPSVRFFAGGDQSVRGFDYNTLGPTDGAGNVIGGKHLLVGSLEYEHRVAERWSAAVFYDVGNAVNSLDIALERGAGFGVRWRSPVGWLRVDLARALTKDDQPWRLHLTLGPDL